jgi:hypothetical protein
VDDGGRAGVGVSSDAARVLTETLKETALPLVTGKVAGTVQLAPKGAPEQVNAKVPLKPAPGVTCRLYCAVWPAVTLTVVEPPVGVATVAAGAAVPVMLRD